MDVAAGIAAGGERLARLAAAGTSGGRATAFAFPLPRLVLPAGRSAGGSTGGRHWRRARCAGSRVAAEARPPLVTQVSPGAHVRLVGGSQLNGWRRCRCHDPVCNVIHSDAFRSMPSATHPPPPTVASSCHTEGRLSLQQWARRLFSQQEGPTLMHNFGRACMHELQTDVSLLLQELTPKYQIHQQRGPARDGCALLCARARL